METEDHRFRLELLKLLLQVAWADLEMRDDEKARLVGIGRRWGLAEPEMAALEKRLEARTPLPAPNLGLLRSRRAEVLDVVYELAHSDGFLADEERDMLAQIEALLA